MKERHERRFRLDARLRAQLARIGEAPQRRAVPAGIALRGELPWRRMVDWVAPMPQHGDAAHVGMSSRQCGREAFPIATRWFCHSLAFLLAALVATDYTVRRFYTLGAAMWDSGWFAHLAATGLRNPPAIGGSFLCDHMSLVFVITALAHELTPNTPAPVFFALTQGTWFGLLGLAASLCLRPLLPTVPAVTLSVLGAMNGISLAAIGFPHIEIAIPA